MESEKLSRRKEMYPCKRKRRDSTDSIDKVEETLPAFKQEVKGHDSSPSNLEEQHYTDIQNPGFEVFEETGEIIHIQVKGHEKLEFSAPGISGTEAIEFESSNSSREALAENLLFSNSERSRLGNKAGKLEPAECKIREVLPETSCNLTENIQTVAEDNINSSSVYPISNLQLFRNSSLSQNNSASSDSTTGNGLTRIENINDIPCHILINVFRNLSIRQLLCTASLVCKLWHQVARDPDLWRVIDLQYQHKLDDLALCILTSFSDRVMYVNLGDTKLITNHGIQKMLRQCPYLQTLKLTRCFDLADDGLTNAGRNCWNLQGLFLEGCYKITNKSLIVVGEGCRKLQQLHLSRCYNISDAGLIAIAENCPDLQQISLDHCGNVTNSGIIAIAQNCRSMEYMALMSCDLTDDALEALRQLKKLRILDISNIPRITPSCLSVISAHCPELECLNISLNTQIGDDCVINIVKYGHKLRRLYCVSCTLTDRALTDIGKYSKTIQTLDVGWCKDVTDEGIRTISATCPTLSYIGLIRCDKITVEGIELLVQQYPRINYSTFILESRKLIERARREGFKFENNDNDQSGGSSSKSINNM